MSPPPGGTIVVWSDLGCPWAHVAVARRARLGLAASEALDAALRDALFGQSRCISMRHVILEVAEECGGVDAKGVGFPVVARDDDSVYASILERSVGTPR